VCNLFRAPALKLTTARLKLLLISGVSSVCRVTGPPVNKGLFAGSAGIASVLSTFIGTSSFQCLGVHVPVVPVVQAFPHVWNDWNIWKVWNSKNSNDLASPYPVAEKISSAMQ